MEGIVSGVLILREMKACMHKAPLALALRGLHWGLGFWNQTKPGRVF